MRTTLTLDADVAALVKKAMRSGRSLKEVVNDALRRGLGESREAAPFTQRTFDMGEPLVPLDKALQLAADLEDEELVRKMAIRK